MEGQDRGAGGPLSTEDQPSFVLASVKPTPPPAPPPAQAGLALACTISLQGRCSCDWIIYSSSLRFLTRKYHTKGKVMKSHLSLHVPHSLQTAGLSRSRCGRRRREGAHCPHPCLPTSCQSQRISPHPSHTHPLPFLSLSLMHFLTDDPVRSLSPSQLSLPKSFPPRLPPQTLTHPWPFSFHHCCLPCMTHPLAGVGFFALSMKTPAH